MQTQYAMSKSIEHNGRGCKGGGWVMGGKRRWTTTTKRNKVHYVLVPTPQDESKPQGLQTRTVRGVINVLKKKSVWYQETFSQLSFLAFTFGQGHTEFSHLYKENGSPSLRVMSGLNWNENYKRYFQST